MRRFYDKKWVRVLCWILCIISFNLMAGSLIGVILLENAGIYQDTQENVRNHAYDSVIEQYSILAVSRYQDDFGMEELADTNFRYGVIQADDIERLDLNDPGIYQACNFDRQVSRDMLHVYSCNMGKDTGYYIQDSLFGNSYIYNNGETREKTYPIEGYFYVKNGGYVYYLANGKLYPRDVRAENTAVGSTAAETAADVQGEAAMVVDTADGIDDAADGIGETAEASSFKWDDEILVDLAEDGTQTCRWVDPQTRINIAGDDTKIQLAEVQIISGKELDQYGTPVSTNEGEDGYEEFYCSRGTVHVYEYTYGESKPYYVLSYVNQPLETKGAGNYLCQDLSVQIADWDWQDFFVQVTVLIQRAYEVSDVLYVLAFAGILLFLFSLGGLLAGAGHRSGDGSVTAGAVDRIPFDLFSFAVMILMGILIGMVIAVGMEGVAVRILIMLGFFGFLCSEILGFLWLESFAVRLKLGRWWENTICWKIICVVWKTLRKYVRFVKEMIFGIFRSIPLLWKAWLIIGALAAAEFFVIMITGYHPEGELVFWFFEKILICGAVILALLQMKMLQEESEKIAAGEIENQVDTTRMFWEFKKHGENLNCIREGMGRAVAERMKSERFKTELITNVSHDIKTPLTSIINYVDLLEKEDIENPRVQEYLEVLDRQSARLKKLIEDLMEASKASTGNLTVMNEVCDIPVMLTQTVGEFAEKLERGEIELLVKSSGESFAILADPRHLFRIFDNLINNICKYAQPATRAYINIERDGAYGKIIFRNISKYELNIGSEELMERFVRGDSSRNTEGSGLGISIAKSLTELMQGNFELVVDGDLFKVILCFPVVQQPEDRL